MLAVMNKSELISCMAEHAEITKKDAEKALNGLLCSIENELKNGGKVQILGFGTFEAVTKNARLGKNPKTKEEFEIPKKVGVKFKAGQPLKNMLNE